MKCKNCDSMEIYATGLCQKCYSKAHYAVNRDEISAKAKLYHEANKDEINARSKAWYEANRDEANTRSKLYREVNKDKIKLYRESHKDEISASGKLYRDANKDKLKEYREVNKDKIKLYREVNRDPNTARLGSEEFRINCSCGQQGIAVEDFDGFATDQKYCEKFNNECREKNRNKYDRECFICGKDEIDNGRKLSVHHVDMNKNQGCDSLWSLVPLCASCHGRAHSKLWQSRIEYLLN